MDLPMSRQREVAREVEAAGMDSLWTSDQFGRDPIMICQAWAEATTTLDVGVGVLQMLTRSIPQVAKAAATVQEESDGRFKLGFGISTPGANRMHGVEQPPALSAARDAIAIFNAIFAGETTDYDGKVLSSHGFQLVMTPHP